MATSYINTLYHMCIEFTSRANSDFEFIASAFGSRFAYMLLTQNN